MILGSSLFSMPLFRSRFFASVSLVKSGCLDFTTKEQRHKENSLPCITNTI
jgi:hypothetical protein